MFRKAEFLINMQISENLRRNILGTADAQRNFVHHNTGKTRARAVYTWAGIPQDRVWS